MKASVPSSRFDTFPSFLEPPPDLEHLRDRMLEQERVSAAALPLPLPPSSLLLSIPPRPYPPPSSLTLLFLRRLFAMADSSRYERVASPTHSTGRRSSDEIEDDGEDEKPILVRWRGSSLSSLFLADCREIQDATPRANPAFTRNFKRQLQISLLLLAVSTLTLLRTSASLFHSPSSSLSRPFALPPTRVGPRPVTAPDGLPLYDSCSTEEFLDAVKRATVREDGKIKNIDFTTEVTNIELPPVEYSFDFPADSKCKPPRVYNQEEACELLGAYGGWVLCFPRLESSR